MRMEFWSAGSALSKDRLKDQSGEGARKRVQCLRTRPFLLPIFGVIFGLIALAAIGFVALTPFPGLTLRILTEALFPATISWDGKTAWRRCDSAIAARTSWPATAPAACEAMHLCANEAPLSEVQRRALEAMIAKVPNCATP